MITLRVSVFTYIFFSLLPLALAETYSEWLAQAPQGDKALSVKSTPVTQGLDKVSVYLSRAKSKEIISRPPGGLVGTLEFTLEAGALDIESPLKLEFFGLTLTDEDLSEGQRLEPLFFKGLNSNGLHKNSSLRHKKYRESFYLGVPKQGLKAKIPVVLPLVSRSHTSNFYTPVLSYSLEITDNKGRICGRFLLVDAFASAQYQQYKYSAWVSGDPEADRLLRDRLGIQHLETIESLPNSLYPFVDVDALWYSEVAWNKNEYTRSQLRKMLLMGTWIHAYPDTVSSIADFIGKRNSGRVLMGGLLEPEKFASDEKHLRHSGRISIYNNYGLGHGFVEDSLKRYIDSHRYFTLGFSIAFASFILLVVPVLFLSLRGRKRLVLWLLVPIVCISFAITGFVFGKHLLPKSSLLSVLEYRFAYLPWKEVYVHDSLEVLNLRPGPVDVSLDASSPLFADLGAGRNIAYRERINREDDNTLISIEPMQLGRRTRQSTGHFANLPLPIEIDSASSAGTIIATSNLHSVYIWTDGTWHEVGVVSPGQKLLSKRKRRPTKLIPDHMREIFSGASVPDISRKKRLEQRFGGDRVVLAVTEEEPVLKVQGEELHKRERVIWIIQVPGPANPREGDNA